MSLGDGFFEVGKRIRLLRGQLTQAEFAARLGVDRKSVVGWEAGKRLPDGASLLRLMQEFGADVNFLLTGSMQAPESETLTPRERALLDNYRHSPPEGQRVIEGTARLGAQPAAAAGGSKR